MFVASAIAYACYRMNLGGLWPLGWPDLGFALLEAIFFRTSRDTLRKYYNRSQQLLQTNASSVRRRFFRRLRKRFASEDVDPSVSS